MVKILLAVASILLLTQLSPTTAWLAKTCKKRLENLEEQGHAAKVNIQDMQRAADESKIQIQNVKDSVLVSSQAPNVDECQKEAKRAVASADEAIESMDKYKDASGKILVKLSKRHGENPDTSVETSKEYDTGLNYHADAKHCKKEMRAQIKIGGVVVRQVDEAQMSVNTLKKELATMIELAKTGSTKFFHCMNYEKKAEASRKKVIGLAVKVGRIIARSKKNAEVVRKVAKDVQWKGKGGYDRQESEVNAQA